MLKCAIFKVQRIQIVFRIDPIQQATRLLFSLGSRSSMDRAAVSEAANGSSNLPGSIFDQFIQLSHRLLFQ